MTRTLFIGLIFGCLTVFWQPLGAQDPFYVLSVSDGEALPSSTRTLTVHLDNFGGEVQGWSLSACHDQAFLTLLDAAAGQTVLGLNGGKRGEKKLALDLTDALPCTDGAFVFRLDQSSAWAWRRVGPGVPGL